jgi:hypothetical protein
MYRVADLMKNRQTYMKIILNFIETLKKIYINGKKQQFIDGRSQPHKY